MPTLKSCTATTALIVVLASGLASSCDGSRPSGTPPRPSVTAGKFRASGRPLFGGDASGLDMHLGVRASGAWSLELPAGSKKKRLRYGIETWEGDKVVKPCNWTGANALAPGDNDLSISVRDATDGSGGLVTTVVWRGGSFTMGSPYVTPATEAYRSGSASWTETARDTEHGEGDETALWAFGRSESGHTVSDPETAARGALWAIVLKVQLVD